MADSVHLTTGNSAPHRFVVDIAVQPPGWGSRSVTVTSVDPATGGDVTRHYRLPSNRHDAYLDLFDQLARDFGTRTPFNRRAQSLPAQWPAVRALLTHNLSADILYGYGDPAVVRIDGHAQSSHGGDDASSGADASRRADANAAADGAVSGRYCVIVTSNDAPDSFPILCSDGLDDWRLSGFAFPRGHKPGWAAEGEGRGDYWAPELHRIADKWCLYFSAREAHTGCMAIGVATGESVTGPFCPAPSPLIRGNVIDPNVLVDHDGAAYLFWKVDTNDVWPGLLTELLATHGHLIARLFPKATDQRTASLAQAMWPWTRTLAAMERFCALQPLIEAVVEDFTAFRNRLNGLRTGVDAPTCRLINDALGSMQTLIRCQRVSDDGLRLVGEPAVVLCNDLPWEAHVIEGIWVTRYALRYYMFYVGNDFSTANYGIGVAVADSVLGPYRKMPEPLLRSSSRWQGPGHPSVATGPDGRPMLFFHAFLSHKAGYKEFRALLCVPIRFTRDGVQIDE